MEPDQFKNVYFLGIGGIGMSALARYFLKIGATVSGYDKTRTSLTDQLSKEGIHVHYDENVEALPEDIDLVVYTPAIPQDHQELVYFRKSGKLLMKRSEVLGVIASRYKVIAVAGTHGKTTITSMIAYILSCAGIKMVAFIGGIAGNFKTNFIYDKDAEYMIVEADEYDRSFLTLYPDIAVITSMDADHLDIYSRKDALTESFMKFCEQLKPEGALIIKKNLPFPVTLFSRVQTYSSQSRCDNYAGNIQTAGNMTSFDLNLQGSEIKNISIPVPGMHNVENAVAASAVANKAGIPADEIKNALSSFVGVQRRFDYRINTPELVFIDDYAHHPRELDAIIGSVKNIYPCRKVTGIFQPHLYTRTRDLADDFAASLSALDELILLDIYPARELPIEGINSEMLMVKVSSENKKLLSKTDLLHYVENHTFDVLLTMGAGDIDQLVSPIEAILNKKLIRK